MAPLKVWGRWIRIAKIGTASCEDSDKKGDAVEERQQTTSPESTYPERYFEDFRVGDRFVTGALTMTREDCLAFARAYDPQPFHLDDEAGRASVFGKLAASGWQTSAVTMRLVVDSGILRATGILGLGVDEIRWHAPVYPADTLRVEGEVIELIPSPHGKRFGRMRLRLTTLNQHGTPVMTSMPYLSIPMRPV